MKLELGFFYIGFDRDSFLIEIGTLETVIFQIGLLNMKKYHRGLVNE